MRHKKVTLSIFLLIVMTDIGESLAQLFMKKGLNDIGITSVTLGNLLEFAAKSCGSPWVWAGLFLVIANFFLWIAILTKVDLSVAFPVGSTSYIFVPLLATTFLHETITPLRCVGIILIVSGIHFVSKSTHTPEVP